MNNSEKNQTPQTALWESWKHVAPGMLKRINGGNLNGKTDIKDELKAPKATIDNVEAKTSFKSKNISDGISVPGAGGGGSLSAKLKTEDAPKE